jgi:hypothetical protein
MKIFLTLSIVLLGSLACHAQNPFRLPKKGDPHRTILLGQGFSVTRLQSARAQSRFGNQQGQINGIYPILDLVRPKIESESDSDREKPNSGIQFDQDFNFDYRSRGKNSLLTVPIDLGVKQSILFGQNRAFWKVGGSAVLTQMYAESEGIKRGWRLATGGVVSGGVTLGNTFSVEAGYRNLSKVRGFDLSSTFVTVSLRFPVGRTR